METTTPEDVLLAMRDVECPFVTVGDVAEAIKCSHETARRKLTELHDSGDIERREIGASTVAWWVPDSGKMARISRRHGDDHYGENPGWADELPNLSENV